MQSILRALRDQFTRRMMLYALLPLLVVMPLMVWATLDLFGGEAGGGAWLVGWFARIPLIGGAAEWGWFGGMLSLLGQTAGWLLVLLAGLFLAIAVVGLLTPSILAALQRRHYPDVVLRGSVGVGGQLRFYASTLLRFVLLLLLMLPLMFVPLVNLVALNLPFYYWFHRLLCWDVASTIYPPDALAERMDSASAGLRGRTLLLYPLTLVPLLGMLLPVLFVLVLGHYLLAREAVGAAAGDSTPRIG